MSARRGDRGQSNPAPQNAETPTATTGGTTGMNLSELKEKTIPDLNALARDLKRLVSSGFVLESASVFDMFPQTHHFESLAWLRSAAGQ